MCAAYDCLNKASTYKRNLLRCLRTSCKKQIELLNVVVNITKTLHYERVFTMMTNQKKHIAGDNFHVIFYICMIFFFLKALYNQNRINIQLHTFKPR